MIIVRKFLGYPALPNTQYLYNRLREPDDDTSTDDSIEMAQLFLSNKNFSTNRRVPK